MSIWQRWRTPVLKRKDYGDDDSRYVIVNHDLYGIDKRFICADGLKQLMGWKDHPQIVQLQISTTYEEWSILIHLMLDEREYDERGEVRQVMAMIAPGQHRDDGDLVDNGIRTPTNYYSMTGNLEKWLNEQQIFTGFYWISRCPSGYESDDHKGKLPNK